MTEAGILIGKGEHPCMLQLARANRHGLVAGATGTGKTVTLQVLAEGFSRAGVPVFCADMKGDLSGIALAGRPTRSSRSGPGAGRGGLRLRGLPVVFWDLFGQQGHPMRATVAEMGPLLLARMLELNDTQEGVLNIAFKLADDEGLLLLDFKDLRAAPQPVAERAGELATTMAMSARPPSARSSAGCWHSNSRAASSSSASRPCAGRPDALTPDGRGAVNVLAADKLIARPGSTPPSCSGCCPSCSRNCRR